MYSVRKLNLTLPNTNCTYMHKVTMDSLKEAMLTGSVISNCYEIITITSLNLAITQDSKCIVYKYKIIACGYLAQ